MPQLDPVAIDSIVNGAIPAMPPWVPKSRGHEKPAIVGIIDRDIDNTAPFMTQAALRLYPVTMHSAEPRSDLLIGS